MLVFHFTDTTRLPWIVETGELRPDKNRIGGLPVDLLWATTDPNGDKTSSALMGAAKTAYRQGFTQLVRITLPATEFRPWRDVVAELPEWTPAHIATLEQAAAKVGQTDTARWVCRSQPILLSRAVSVHAKSFASGRWVQVEATQDWCIIDDHNQFKRAFVCGGRAYFATRSTLPDGRASYGDVYRVDAERLD